MSHAEQITFFRLAMKHFPSAFSAKVIDIGSLDINGGPHRDLQCEEYVGVDVAAGPNVTLVSRGEDVDLPPDYFDVAMSSECFEHNPSWRETLDNMIRMTKPLGLIVFTCASVGRLEHGTTRSDLGYAAPLTVGQGQEHYENVSRRMLLRALDKESLAAFRIYTNYKSGDLYFIAVKATTSTELGEKCSHLIKILEDFDARAKEFLRLENQNAVTQLPHIIYSRMYQRFYFSSAYKHFFRIRKLMSRKN